MASLTEQLKRELDIMRSAMERIDNIIKKSDGEHITITAHSRYGWVSEREIIMKKGSTVGDLKNELGKEVASEQYYTGSWFVLKGTDTSFRSKMTLEEAGIHDGCDIEYGHNYD